MLAFKRVVGPDHNHLPSILENQGREHNAIVRWTESPNNPHGTRDSSHHTEVEDHVGNVELVASFSIQLVNSKVCCCPSQEQD